MKIELHCHTQRYSPCAAHGPEEMLARLVETGYGAVYLTEHDTVWPERELEALREQFPQIRIFPGVELSPFFQGARHLLVLGTNDAEYLSIRDDAAILERAREDGCLTVLAHPYRWKGGDEMLRAGHRPDAIEYQTPNVEPHQAAQARATAEDIGLPVVNSGDVHAMWFIDKFWIETTEPLQDAKDIRRIVLAGKYRNRRD